MKRNAFIIGVLITATLCAGTDCPGQQEAAKPGVPLWEIGLFNGVAYIPHYRGADEYELWALPLPYLIYRGKILRTNRDGVKGVFFKTSRFELSLSASGNPPVDDDNEAREGMPDLDAIGEIGPAVKWFFLGKSRDSLYLRLSLRGAVSASFDHGLDLAYEGVKAGTNLIYNNRSLYGKYGLGFGLNIGADFCDNRLNGYFYDVAEEYALPERPVYESGGGYAGFSVSATMLKKISRAISLGGYCRWDNINGAVFEDSPLVKAKNNYVAGCALIWTIAESDTLVNPERSVE